MVVGACRTVIAREGDLLVVSFESPLYIAVMLSVPTPKFETVREAVPPLRRLVRGEYYRS